MVYFLALMQGNPDFYREEKQHENGQIASQTRNDCPSQSLQIKKQILIFQPIVGEFAISVFTIYFDIRFFNFFICPFSNGIDLFFF